MTTKLLAVDDSQTLRKVLEITFAGEEFQTELAANSEEALQKLRAVRPAVAVVDTGLGAESGYDLCQQIKSEAPEVAVVLLTSQQRPYDQGRGAQVGADDYIDKPFDTQKLIDKVLALAERPRAAAAPAAPAPAPRPAVSAAPAPRPAVSAAPVAPRPAPSAVPQRPAAPAPSIGARPVAPAPQFGSASQGGPSLGTASRAAAPAPAVAAPAPAAAAAPPKVAAAVAAANADLTGQLQELGLSADQVAGVLALSREVVEKVVWEVVPVLAETLIKEEIARLTAE